jgi:hypothetical protein
MGSTQDLELKHLQEQKEHELFFYANSWLQQIQYYRHCLSWDYGPHRNQLLHYFSYSTQQFNFYMDELQKIMDPEIVAAAHALVALKLHQQFYA